MMFAIENHNFPSTWHCSLFLRNPVRIAFHLLLREFFDDKRRSPKPVFLWVLRQPITLNRFPYLCPIFHVTFLSSFLGGAEGKGGCDFMVPSDMASSAIRRREKTVCICECQPPPQQFATLATTLFKRTLCHTLCSNAIHGLYP